MKNILVDDSVKIYGEASDQSISLATLHKGDEFESGKTVQKGKQAWVQVTLPSGVGGFIPGSARIFVIRQVQLLTNGIELHESTGEESTLLKTYASGTVLTVVGIEGEGTNSWVRVKDSSGTIGYIRGSARIRDYQEPSKKNGKRLFITGIVTVGITILFYLFTVIIQRTNETFQIIMLGLMVFGVIEAVQGYVELKRAKREGK